MHIYWNGMSLDSSTARNECCLRNLPIPPPLACRLAALAVCHVTRKPTPPPEKDMRMHAYRMAHAGNLQTTL